MSTDTTMDSVEGCQYAELVIANIKSGETPDYLHQVFGHLHMLSPAFRRAFLRQLQKEIENNFAR